MIFDQAVAEGRGLSDDVGIFVSSCLPRTRQRGFEQGTVEHAPTRLPHQLHQLEVDE
jgi:hypothetical protein